MSQTQTQTPIQVPEELESLVKEKELIVWQKSTWGNYGQHNNIYTFVIDLEKLEQQPIFKLITTRHENKDSRKNIHRFTYVKISDVFEKLRGKVLKIVHDYASSSKRTVTVEYYLVTGEGLKQLECESGLRDEQGFFDKVHLPDSRVLIVRKNSVQIQN